MLLSYHEHKLSERGVGETRFPHAPARGRVRAQSLSKGMGKPGFPIRSPRGRVWEGAALPRTTFTVIPFTCGEAAWTATVNVGCESQYLSPTRMRCCSPPPNLPPLGGGAGLPPPAGEGWGGGRHLRCNGLPLKQGYGATGFPHAPRPREGVGGGSPQRMEMPIGEQPRSPHPRRSW